MIQLPDFFQKKLAANPALETAVKKNLVLFEPWLEQSGMPFFPGYTDHSPRHINEVLNTAASLISDSSHALLSAEDVAVLCLSILLHDCGMHLTQDGFRALIVDTGPPVNSALGDQPWSYLWKDFLGEARRFGQDRLIAIFGDSDPIQIDKLNVEDLSERDCLLIGEFVRRHHARLAHEIALRHVPIRKGTPLALVELDEDIRDLAGLIARSHGMSIRSTFAYIETKYGLIPQYRKIKTPFLMAVLRIADYVQVKSERALKSLLSVKELRSPISRQEWRNHFAVKDVSTDHKDPEVLYVHANPVDVRTYLKLDSLFKDIQRELDESWATIGEVYGRLGDLSNLGLTIRRIRSNLDEREKFARTVPYVPIKAGFESSGPDLLKLLVGPLYDYKYEVGIRELVQNAVDACRERSDLIQIPQGKNIILENPGEFEIEVSIDESEDGTGWITIVDRGVGMTLETVTKYFLVAGASFRNSDVWKKQHLDVSGQSRVLRGGRFGIGALAAFLLGEEIHITTCHAARTDTDGFEFTARIDDPVVEIRRCRAPAGTSIRVWVSDPKVMDRLRPHVYTESRVSEDGSRILPFWHEVDWFAQASPKIIYRWDGYDRGISNFPEHAAREKLKAQFRQENEMVPLWTSFEAPWQALSDPTPYTAILWHYPKPKKRKEGDAEFEALASTQITVNGMRVQELSTYQDRSRLLAPQEEDSHFAAYRIERPSMAIFDPAGVCPINLQRSAISFDRMGVDQRLASAILRDHFKQFKSLPSSRPSLDTFRKFCLGLENFPGVKYEGLLSHLGVTKHGILLAAPRLLSSLGIKRLFFVDASEKTNSVAIDELLQDGDALLLRRQTAGTQSDLAWFRSILADNSWYARSARLPKLTRTAALSLITKETWELANQKGKVKRDILSALREVHSPDEMMFLVNGALSDEKTVRSQIELIQRAAGQKAQVGVWILDESQRPTEAKSLIYDIWVETFGVGLLAH